MRPLILLTLLLIAALAVGLSAHHGSADYHVDREITVAGIVKEWRWSNPHTWVFVTVRKAGETTEEWEGEGPPLTWAVQRGWSNVTLRVGEEVSLVMYPAKQQMRAGLVKQIQRRSGEVLLVSRPWLEVAR